MMKEKFLKVAFQRQLFTKHKAVLIAISGGLDSMNLLHLLESCQIELGITIGLAHVHYGQRPEADQEASYLEKYAKDHSLPFYVTYFKGQFSEENARDFRYQFFERIMVEKGYTALVTAHHADDQAETVLMRLLRGSRLFHLSAIKEKQPFANGELLRPLLRFSKSDLADVFHFEDSSNQSQQYFRNRIRQTYLPQLTQENPKLKEHLCSLAQEVSDLKTALSYFVTAIDYRQLDTFKSYPEGLQIFFLQDYLSQFPDLQIGKSQFEEIIYLLNHKRNRTFPLKSGYALFLDYQHFSIQKSNLNEEDSKETLVIEAGTVIEYGAYQFGFDFPLTEADQVLELPTAEKVILRHRQAGDTILIQGHHKKIRRLFIDNKCSSALRDSAILIEQSGEILSILGFAVSDLSKFLKSDTIGARLYIKKIKMEEVSC